MGRIVKFRLVTYFDEVENQVTPNGETVLVERLASMGDEVDFRPADEERLDSLGALYTEDEAKAIQEGSYRGTDAGVLATFRGTASRPTGTVTAAEGEGNPGDIDSYPDAVALGEHIRDTRPNVEGTLALLPDNPSEEQIQKLYDAENIATGDSPRSGVVDKLDRLLAEKSE